MSDIKQVIVIRKDLKMRRGKEVAQGAHASLAVFLNLMKEQNSNNIDSNINNEYCCKFVHNSEAMHKWMQGSFTKICLTVDSEQELLDIYNKANDSNIICSIIKDSGRTEFKGIETYTTVAIGPDFSSKIDPITKDLKLY